MEAGAVAAAYVAETVVEAGVVGATVVAQPTSPLHARCTKLAAPSLDLTARSGHSVSVIKGKAYIFGGKTSSSDEGDNAVHIVSLPTDSSLKDTDYRRIEPLESSPVPRQGHASAVVGELIFIYGGSKPGSSEPLDENGAVHIFDTESHQWTTYTPHSETAPSDNPVKTPSPRVYASATSSIHPLPAQKPSDFTNNPKDGKPEDALTTELSVPGSSPHGTFILHGGYDGSGTVLNDIWAFDVLAKTWSQWPDVPSADGGDASAPGLIICVGTGLWAYINGNTEGEGASRVYVLELQTNILDDASGKSEIAITPKIKNVDETAAEKEGDATSEDENGWHYVGGGGVEERVEEKMKGTKPVPGVRTGTSLSLITTGQGREYLILPYGSKSRPGSSSSSSYEDIWTFQLPPSKGFNGARLKDWIRSFFGGKTGEAKWSRVSVVESTKEEGPLETPGPLVGFGVADGGDWENGSLVIWGGEGEGGELRSGGWIVGLE